MTHLHRRPQNWSNAATELDVVMDETFVDTGILRKYLMLRRKERGVTIQGETAAVIEGVFTSSVELTSGLRFNCDEVNYVVTEKISAGHYKLRGAETLGTVGNSTACCCQSRR